MEIIYMILLGALVGWVASMIMNTNAQMGAIANIVVGIVGSILGGLVYSLLTSGTASFSTAFLNFSFPSLIISILGAVLLLAILKMFNRRNTL